MRASSGGARGFGILAIGAALVACAAACAGGSGGGSASPGAAASGAVTPPTGSGGGSGATPAPAPSRWWRGDLHVHTRHSGDASDTVGQTLAMARHQGLDFIVLSDHDTVAQAQDPEAASTPGLEVIIGCEWTEVAHGGIVGARSVPADLHPPGVPIGQPGWQAGVDAAIAQAHADGAAFVLNHPTWHLFPWIFEAGEADAVEVWNSFFTVGDTGLHPTSVRRLQERLDEKGLTPFGFTPSAEIERAVRASGSANDQALRYWEAFLDQGKRMAAVGGSDRHEYLLPGYPCTWVLAPSNEGARIVDGIRAARTMVTAGPRGPLVRFEADGDGDGAFESTIGDIVSAARAIDFRVIVDGARGGQLRVIRRGQIIHDLAIPGDGFAFTFQEVPNSGDWYRVDVFQPVDWRLPFASQALALASGQSAHLPIVFSLFGVSLSLQANRPVIDFDEGYLRVLSADIAQPTLSRAAITSPIYAR